MTKIPCGGFELDDSLTLNSEKKLGVNWGGQVQSDLGQNDENAPDYVKNRLCYTEYEYSPGVPNDGSFTPVKFSFERMENYYYRQIDSLILTYGGGAGAVISSGSTVRIIFDDKEYILKAESTKIDNDTLIFVGNRTILEGSVTEGIPFCIIFLGGFVEVFAPLGNGDTHTIQIDLVTSENVHQLDQKYIPGNAVVVNVTTDIDDNFIADKSFDDIMTAIDDGKYVVVSYPVEDEVFQLSDVSSYAIRFSRTSPYNISRFSITKSNDIEYEFLDLEGDTNWLLTYDEDGYLTPVDSLDYIKLKSPNGTLYTISVTDDGTIQANAES